MKSKTCVSCGIEKPECKFRKYRIGRSNPESRLNSCISCRSKRNRLLTSDKRSNAKLRREIISAYGGKCACCGESFQEFLSIDHTGNWNHTQPNKSDKRGGMALYRKLRALGFPKDAYRLLCFNCNMSVGIYGYCPHRPLIACKPAWEMAMNPQGFIPHGPDALGAGLK